MCVYMYCMYSTNVYVYVQCWEKLLLKVMHYNIVLLSLKK